MRQRLNAQYRSAAEEFARRAISALGNQVDSVVLYGSVARGQAKRDSDVDVLVVGPDPTRIKHTLSTIRGDFIYESGFSLFISLAYLSRDEIDRLARMGSPFIRNVLAEGIVLYDSGTLGRLRQGAIVASRGSSERRPVSA